MTSLVTQNATPTIDINGSLFDNVGLNTNVSKNDDGWTTIETLKQRMIDTEENLKILSNLDSNTFDTLVIIDKYNGKHEFDKVWDELFVTVIGISNHKNSKHNLVSDRRIYSTNYLYFKTGNLYTLNDNKILPKCNAMSNESHQLRAMVNAESSASTNDGVELKEQIRCRLCSFSIGDRVYECHECKESLCEECVDSLICNSISQRMRSSNSKLKSLQIINRCKTNKLAALVNIYDTNSKVRHKMKRKKKYQSIHDERKLLEAGFVIIMASGSAEFDIVWKSVCVTLIKLANTQVENTLICDKQIYLDDSLSLYFENDQLHTLYDIFPGNGNDSHSQGSIATSDNIVDDHYQTTVNVQVQQKRLKLRKTPSFNPYSVESILDCIRYDLKDADTLIHCCDALVNLCDKDLNQKTLIIDMGLKDLFSIIKENYDVTPSLNEQKLLQAPFVDSRNGKRSSYSKTTKLIEHVLNLLCNLCYNSPKCRVLICNYINNIHVLYNSLIVHIENRTIVTDGLHILGGVSYISNNVEKIFVSCIKNDKSNFNIVKLLVSLMAQYLQQVDILNLCLAVLANFSVNGKAAKLMVKQNIVNVIVNVSIEYTDLVSMQQFCINCLGNLAVIKENVHVIVENGIHLHILDIVKKFYRYNDGMMTNNQNSESLGQFQAETVILIRNCLQIIGLLCVDHDFATLFVTDDYAWHPIQQILIYYYNLHSNFNKQYIATDNEVKMNDEQFKSNATWIIQYGSVMPRQCCKTLRKLIVSKKSVRYLKKNSNVIQILAKIINLHHDLQHLVYRNDFKYHDNNSKIWVKYQNFINNLRFMNSILRTFEILCHASGWNCEFVAHYCPLTILKFIHNNIINYNPKYLDGVTALLARLSLHEDASAYLIRRDVCRQVLNYIELLLLVESTDSDIAINIMDPQRSDIIGKLVRCLTNLIFTNRRAVGLLTKLSAENIISQCLRNPDGDNSSHTRSLRTEIEEFLSAMNKKSGANQQQTQ